MLQFFLMLRGAGGDLRRFAAAHPAIKWLVIVVVCVLALEALWQEGLSLYIQTQTVQATVEKAKAEAATAQMQNTIIHATPAAPGTVVKQLKAKCAEGDKSACDKLHLGL